MQELPLIFLQNIEKDHEIHKESKKVLGPEVKELDHASRDLVKLFILVCPSLMRRTSVLEACNGKPSTDQNIRPKDINALNDTAWYVGAQSFAGLFVVIHRAKDTHEREKDILVHKVPRQDSLVGIISRIFQLGQYLERKVSRCTLENA